MEFFEKLLWVCIPALLAAVATQISSPRLDSQIAIYAIAILVACVGLVSSNSRRERRKIEKENEADRELIHSALRALLRSELMGTHHNAVRDGYATTVEKEVMERTYRSYHNLGGNGVATNLYEEVMNLPTKDSKKGD